MDSYMAKAGDVDRTWHLVDAEGQTLGRLATQVATLLRGKHKPTYTPHVDTGDFVVIINAEKIVVTGKKSTDKLYRRHSGWPGGFREVPYAKLHAEKPTRVLEKAIRGMLPHNKLAAAQYNKLNVYAGAEHPHQAQQPKPYALNA